MFKKRSILAIIVTIMVAGTSTFGTLMYLDRRDFRIYLQNQYQRNLYNLISQVENLQVSLSKVNVAGTPRRSLLLFGDVWKDATAAQSTLNALPISHVAISQTSKFLTQVGDYSYYLMKTSNSGSTIGTNEWNNIEKLRDYAGYLSLQLHQLDQQFQDKGLTWEEIKHGGRQVFINTAQNPVDMNFQTISDEMQQYPTLIYDGPFAENVLSIKPKVTALPEVTLDKAKESAMNILGKDRVESLNLYSDKTGEQVPAYAFSVRMKGRKDDNVNIDISRNGGKVIYMLDSREIGAEKLSMKDAVNRGLKYLENIGYRDMIPSYSLKYDSVAVINYIYVKNKVVIYPDQIKLKVALDNGDVVGIESKHYLIAHTDRTIPKPRITSAEAKKNISQKLKVTNIRLAIIPLESTREVFCYEFFGEYDGEKYFVYINALDGNEERILRVLETPNGELTM